MVVHLQLWRMRRMRMTVVMLLAIAGCARRAEPTGSIPLCAVDSPRWARDPEGATRSLRVWIDATTQTLDGWGPYGWRRLRTAMEEWNSIRLPVRLVQAPSLRESEIVVQVIEAIPAHDGGDRDQAGLTSLTHEGTTISRARVFVATTAPFGVRYSVGDQVANLIHELGHAIGLQHAVRLSALMAARRAARELTGADIDLARTHFASCSPASR
jgi:hypothetical protein